MVLHAVDVEQVALAGDDGGDGRVEAAGVLVEDVHAHAGAELVGLLQRELVVSVADVVGQRAGDGGHLLQHGALAADDADAAAEVQGVVHHVRPGRDDHFSPASLGDGVDGLLDGLVGLADVRPFADGDGLAHGFGSGLGRLGGRQRRRQAHKCDSRCFHGPSLQRASLCAFHDTNPVAAEKGSLERSRRWMGGGASTLCTGSCCPLRISDPDHTMRLHRSLIDRYGGSLFGGQWRPPASLDGFGRASR